LFGVLGGVILVGLNILLASKNGRRWNKWKNVDYQVLT
jgi:hypothetical protein